MVLASLTHFSICLRYQDAVYVWRSCPVLLSLYPCPAISVDLQDVVYHGHQLPLAVDFVFSAQAETFYTDGCVDVAKHGFDDAKPFAVVMSPFGTVDLLFHFFDVHDISPIELIFVNNGLLIAFYA